VRHDEPRPTYTASVALRVAPRARIYVHAALGRYFTWGAEWTHIRRWGHYGIRLPFLSVGLIRGHQLHNIRATFMGWRGVDHRPRPDLRVWTA
jgi:hypothetical protein